MKYTNRLQHHNRFVPKLAVRVQNAFWMGVASLMIVWPAWGYFVNTTASYVFADEFISPVPNFVPSPTPTVTPTPTPTPVLSSTVEQEIREVFGEYADRAIEVAMCESKLNPNALNDNTTWGGKGRDHGVFQINDDWQQVHNVKFLRDPAINIRIAWRIFEDNGYSWDRWTCGRR